MKNSNERNVNIFIVIFLLLSILISSLVLATTDTPEMTVKKILAK
jgi:hypothetical protein